MKLLKTALAAAALLAGMGSALANPVTVDGVTWDPDSIADFSAASVAMKQIIDPSTGVVSGYGIVTSMNGQSNFCNNCQLTFQFGGFTPTGSTLIPVAGSVGQTITYADGWVNFYVVGAGSVANPTDVYSLTAANTMSGNTFLAATSHGDFTGVVGGSASLPVLTGSGFLDVVGGQAMGNFNTNTEFDGSDLAFTNSFTNPLKPGSNILTMGGTGNLFGKSIPEPGSVALVGLALAGAGLARRKARR